MAVYGAAVSSLAGSVFIPMMMWLVLAVLLKLYNAFDGEKTPFANLFAVTVYASLPVVLGSMVKTGLMLATPARDITRITVSPALFLPSPEHLPGKTYAFLSQIDPFVAWSLILTAMGGSLAMKVPLPRTAIYLVSLWILYIAAVTLLSGI
jgi:hypothetical protein